MEEKAVFLNFLSGCNSIIVIAPLRIFETGAGIEEVMVAVAAEVNARLSREPVSREYMESCILYPSRLVLQRLQPFRRDEAQCHCTSHDNAY